MVLAKRVESNARLGTSRGYHAPPAPLLRKNKESTRVNYIGDASLSLMGCCA